ncbi:MAG: AAA family ATPase [Thiovulaceae bacterium]|nr:AAA family ATPase [Sulfurimonadaceae bacterium]
MIERFFLKDYLSFKEVELNLSSGLVVFTGPSGSGKSILINSILSSLGNSSCEASICESSTSWDFDGDEYGLECDDINIFKHMKKEKSRYFINNQSVSKKAIQNISAKHLRHLSLKDYSDFENDNLINILDSRLEKHTVILSKLKSEYKKTFLEHKKLSSELKTIIDEESRVTELKEFTKFEIDKIESINPKTDEDLELLEIKKELSKKEKVLEALANANEIFNAEHNVFSALEALDADSSFFSDTMNELRAILDGAEEKFSALDEVDVEEVLNRLEELSDIKRRYGSIEDAIEYKETKKKELEKYENISYEKNEIQTKVNELEQKVDVLSKELSDIRIAGLKEFEQILNGYIKDLYLREIKIIIQDSEKNENGKDEMIISLNGTSLDKISTGEFNRLRLAILALKTENMNKNGGVLMLDEIDANLSGEESMSVAKVLKKLSKYFQIFVISHQPQLTSMGDQHFLVYKENGVSKVSQLNLENRIDEIARIISGDKISDEAKKFAKELLEG